MIYTAIKPMSVFQVPLGTKLDIPEIEAGTIFKGNPSGHKGQGNWVMILECESRLDIGGCFIMIEDKGKRFVK